MDDVDVPSLLVLWIEVCEGCDRLLADSNSVIMYFPASRTRNICLTLSHRNSVACGPTYTLRLVTVTTNELAFRMESSSCSLHHGHTFVIHRARTSVTCAPHLHIESGDIVVNDGEVHVVTSLRDAAGTHSATDDDCEVL